MADKKSDSGIESSLGCFLEFIVNSFPYSLPCLFVAIGVFNKTHDLGFSIVASLLWPLVVIDMIINVVALRYK